jgi:F-type H+-transporting ATPase subunit a
VGSHYEFFGPPTADVNLPLAMAVFVIVLVHIASLRSRGLAGYIRHYFSHPFSSKGMAGRILVAPFNFFLTVIEEIAKPITLALRLFGNLFSGGLMLSLIAALGAWKLSSFPIGDITTFIFAIIWKVFDVFFIGPIQAFIFTLLTILYFDTAMATEH